MNTPFAYGEKVLLLDLKQRRYLITLAEGAEFHSHNGFFAHSDLVGQLESREEAYALGARAPDDARLSTQASVAERCCPARSRRVEVSDEGVRLSRDCCGSLLEWEYSAGRI